MKTEIEYILTTGIEFHKGGELAVSKNVLLLAPSSKQLKHTVAMKQAFFQAISSFESEKKKESTKTDEFEMSGSDVLSMLYMSTVDMEKFFNSARELFKSGAALLDGKQQFNDLMIDKVSVEDFEGMVGEYLINFIIASALKKMTSSS